MILKKILLLILLTITLMGLTNDEKQIIMQIPPHEEQYIQTLKQKYLQSNHLNNTLDAIRYGEEYSFYIKKYFGIESRLYGNIASDLTIFYASNKDENNMFKYYNLSLPLLKKYNYYSKVALLHQSLGSYYSDTPDLDKAEEFLNKAEKVYNDYGVENCSFYQVKGYWYQRKDNYALAIHEFKKSLDLCTEQFGKDSFEVLKVQNTLLEYYNSFGGAKISSEIAEKIVKITERLDDSSLKGSLYNKLGVYFKGKKQYQEALHYFNRALELGLLKSKDKHFSIGTIHANMGAVLSSSENNESNTSKAKEHYIEALKIYYSNSENKETAQTASVNDSLARILLVESDDRGLQYLEKSVKYYEENNDSSPSAMNTFMLMSIFYSDIPQIKNSLKSYIYAKKSFDIFQKNKLVNFTFRTNKEQLDFLIKNKDYLKILLDTSFENKSDVGTTFQDWINYKGSLFDFENSISRLYRQVLESKDEKIIKLIQEFNLNKENKKLKRDIKSATLRYGSKVFQKVLEQDIIKVLNSYKSDGFYIDFIKTDTNYYLFTLDKLGNLTFDKISEETSKNIDENIKIFQEEMDTDGTIENEKNQLEIFKPTLVSLYNDIFPKHIQKKFNLLRDDTQLIISPDGQLNFLPFESLIFNSNNCLNKMGSKQGKCLKKSKYIIQKFNVTYTPSAKELVRLSKEDKITTDIGNIVSFSKIDFGAKLSNLKYASLSGSSTNKECKENILELTQQPLEPLSAQKRAIPYMGEKASEEKLLALKDIKNLDIVTHGIYCPDKNILNPMSRTMLLLSGANRTIKNSKDKEINGQGIVTALEISTINLEGTNLVTLSACQTGLGEINNAEGVESINKAFIQAGAKNVISTLWSVATMETDELMTKFYENNNSVKNPSKVLRSVKLDFIKNNRHPYFWSGFVLYGEGR